MPDTGRPGAPDNAQSAAGEAHHGETHRAGAGEARAGEVRAGEAHGGKTHRAGAGEAHAGEAQPGEGQPGETHAGEVASADGAASEGAAATGAAPVGAAQVGAAPIGAAPVDGHRRPLWRTVLTPRWTGLLVLALAIAAVMSVMGVWQIGVYQSKTADATAERAATPPVPLQSLFSIDEGLPSKAVGRRVTVSGTWAPAADQVFIADRLHDGRDGFWVVSPLKLSSTDAVMIIRGWVPTVTDPAATAPSGEVSLTGSVISSEAEDASGDAAKGRVLSSLRIPTIVHLVKYRLYDAFVVQASVESGAVPSPAPAAVTPPPPPTDHAGLRNIAYAFQWWIFAAFTLWMWARMVLDAHRDPIDGYDAAPTDTNPTDEDPTHADLPHGDSTGAHRADPDRAEPDRTNPDRTNPDRTNPDRTNPDRTNPDRTNPDRTNAHPTKAEPTDPEPAGPAIHGESRTTGPRTAELL